MKDWRTTVIGAVLAGLTSLEEYLRTGEVSGVRIAISVAIAVLGFLAKDAFNKPENPAS